MPSVNAIVLDTETTDLDEPQPVEVAWIRLNGPTNLTAIEEFRQRYKPSKPITLGALATHHILDEELVDCPPCSEFNFPSGVEFIIGHNVDFDWQVIGMPIVKRIDTVPICRKLWPQADSHGLGAMLYLLERPIAKELLKDAHSASSDALCLVRILGHVLKAIGNPQTWDEVWKYSEAARIPEFMPFGMHKGMRIVDLPVDYKRWLLSLTDIDPYLIKALRGEK